MAPLTDVAIPGVMTLVGAPPVPVAPSNTFSGTSKTITEAPPQVRRGAALLGVLAVAVGVLVFIGWPRSRNEAPPAAVQTRAVVMVPTAPGVSVAVPTPPVHEVPTPRGESAATPRVDSVEAVPSVRPPADTPVVSAVAPRAMVPQNQGRARRPRAPMPTRTSTSASTPTVGANAMPVIQ